MTSLRDIFKKTKKTAKETTDKILDADIEENVSKVAVPLAEATVTGIGGALKLIFFVLIPITVVVMIIYSLIEGYTEKKWCNNTYYNIFGNQNAIQKLDLSEVQELTKTALDYNCNFHIKNEDNKPIFDLVSWAFYLDRIKYSVMTDKEKENYKNMYHKSKDSTYDINEELLKKLNTEELSITNPSTWGQGSEKSYENKTNKQILNELNQLID